MSGFMDSFERSHPSMMVVTRGTGDAIGFFVVNDYFGPAIAGPFWRHSDAWRWIDRQEGEPINRSEDTAAWSWTKRVHGE